MQRPQFIYLLCGPSLSGKSTACAHIAKEIQAVVISADAIKSERGLPFGAEGLPESVWAETLEIMLSRIHDLANRGIPIIVDDTLCFRWLRDRFREEARANGLEPRLLLLFATKDQLLARHAALLKSGQRSVLSLPQLLEHLESFEWPTQDENALDISLPGRLAECLRSHV